MACRVSLAFFLAVMAGCVALRENNTSSMRIPHLQEAITVDGFLDESCYQEQAPWEGFVVAGDSSRIAPPTKAWLFWNEDALYCTFECEDPTPVSMPPSEDERDVDPQDRAEIFLWTGDADRIYHCIEAAPGGAIHDYAARFYRKFDDTWSPVGGWACKARETATGYIVEMMLPEEAMKDMGVKLRQGHTFRLGLFRADYEVPKGPPTWITWVDHGREPDFHVGESFGTAVLIKNNTGRSGTSR